MKTKFNGRGAALFLNHWKYFSSLIKMQYLVHISQKIFQFALTINPSFYNPFYKLYYSFFLTS